MPIEITIDNDKQLTIFSVVGEISFAEIVIAVKQVWKDQRTRKFLWDFRNGTMGNVSSNELNSVAERIKFQSEQNPGGKSALVSGKSVDFGLSRMFEALVEIKRVPHEIKSFTSYMEAMEWLETKEEEKE